MSLVGKKIFVTGGSRGIGASIVKHLAAKEAQVAFSYAQREATAKELVDTLPGSGHFFVKMDVRSEASIEEAVGAVLNHFGQRVDGLVNNAGVTKDTLLLRMKTEDFAEVINTNLMGTFWVCRAFLRTMMKQKSGSIVNVTSIVGQTGNAGQANYAASKGGLVAFTKSMALEMASRGVRANCVAPGFIQTEMTASLPDEQKQAALDRIPLGRLGIVDEVAHPIAFLLSDESAYITGQTLAVNGGLWMGN